MKKPIGVHWFRRDLRCLGNPALNGLLKLRESGQIESVLALFVVDPGIFAREDFSPLRWQWFYQNLIELKRTLAHEGVDLWIAQGPKQQGEGLCVPVFFEELLKMRLAHETPLTVSWNRDYEPFARSRDLAVEQLLERKGVTVTTSRDHLILEPREVFQPTTRAPYRVFTPFKNQWLKVLEQKGPEFLKLEKTSVSHQHKATNWSQFVQSDFFEKHTYEPQSKSENKFKFPQAGEEAALARCKHFLQTTDYDHQRDFPGVAATSKLSADFKVGLISTYQVLQLAHSSEFKMAFQKMPQFLTELIWREFYTHILWHYPSVERDEFNPKYRNKILKWENDPKLFEAWKEGRTGFSMVDAGMRQLLATGWMHNRVRMVVASFLCKDLLIDYRWGERFFMKHLLDGDLAANNGGWQWAASTGCDPQPYFRVFNPELQAEKFDPKGEYRARWVPEWGTPQYPEPIVNHVTQRLKAIALFSEAKK